MTDLIELHEARPDDFPQDHLRRMAMTNFGAGHETLTSTLTSVLVMLGTHAESAGVRVQAECRSMTKFAAAERGSATVVPYDAVVCTRSSAGLPYTVAAIREAQRLHPVIGMSLARVVPPGGAVIDGHFLPAGTTVGCVPAALHRNRALFGDNADEFVPERWLSTPTPGGAVAGGQKTTGEDTPQPTAAATTGGVPVLERDRYPSLAWGGGARTCPGRNLAELILLKAVPTLVREFDLHLVHVPPEEEMRTYFMAMMTGVRVRFVARKTAGGSSSGERDST